MNEKIFKKSVYIVITIIIIIFFTKEIDLKSKFYKNIRIIDDPENLLVLVNKNNILPKDYVPENLELISLEYANEGKRLVREAKSQFEELSKISRLLGYNIIAVSAYRDYNYQKKLYEGYVKDKGFNYADNCCARPGHSEHQTGLAVDVQGSNEDYNKFDKSYEFKWMKNNAHVFGFILRYPKGKEHITGFKYEPWHYRYVGIDVATKIFNEKLTLEEYYDKYIYKKNK